MWFIIGVILGAITMATSVVYFLHGYIKKRSHKNLIKKIGKNAEDKINDDLKVWSRHSKNKFIPATLYKYSSNKVFEVDSILITPQALIVIEIKSINGGIVGNADDKEWQKVLGDKRHAITNPVRQNQKHIQHILKMLDMKIPVISLIIFSNKAKFIDVSNAASHVVITKHADMFETLDNITESLKISLSSHAMKNLYQKIRSFKTSKRVDVNLHKTITGEKRGKSWK